ncbi:MAG: aminoacetone oxidase family FAD-binding enzyme [Eubacteriaceae bacterium]|nr:aminoacetone oxidase family FAD-binding enzyme [Eubacteriaceae bacterium]
MTYDKVIIGAGAAGLFAASKITAKNGLILEKTSRPGTKLLMSGNGQCNITHGGDIKDYVNHYGIHGKKIRSCIYKYNNHQLMDFLHVNGVETLIREDGKVFPKSLKSSQVLEMLLMKAKSNGFQLISANPVTGIHVSSEKIWTIVTEKGSYKAEKIIIATGGCSYPATGSDGSFFQIMKRDLDIKITRLKPSLSPVNVYNYPYEELSGISFPHASLTLWRNGKKVSQNTNDSLLLTHRNFSGPLVINHSREIETGDTVKINYVYPLNNQDALQLIASAMNRNKADISNVTASLFNLPKTFCKVICARAGNKAKTIAAMLTEDSFTVKSVGGFNTAMATAGGIDLSQINLKTMEFKDYPGLFALGECLDVDGDTGGYNLQFAYSSASAIADFLNNRQ